MIIISIYGSHNASVSIAIDGAIIEVIELERIVNIKNCGLDGFIPLENKEYVLTKVLDYIKKTHKIEYFDICLYQEMYGLQTIIPAKEYIECKHHESHAAGSLYQSNFESCLIISFDGGGNDGFFNVYRGNKKTGVTLIEEHRLDLGVPYMLLGHYMKPIKKENDIRIGNLVYSGKIMGLSAFGLVREEWIERIKSYYLEHTRLENYDIKSKELFDDLNILHDADGIIEINDSHDLATTSQFVFEKLFFQKCQHWLDIEENIIITGGCALNVLLIEKIRQRHSNVFVAPNSSDCGLSIGMLLNYLKPTVPVDVTYLGSSVFDSIIEYLPDYNVITLEIDRIAKDLLNQKIIGVIRLKSEHGPRALGNRSILCNPFSDRMKETLNSRVKNREYYRPFAPVCIEEDAHVYFSKHENSRWMTSTVRIRPEFRSELSAVNHVDNSCRLQTVSESQNSFLYDLLIAFKKLTGIPVLLNTSFNVAGKPMINRYSDAFDMLDNNKIDALVSDRLYIKSRH